MTAFIDTLLALQGHDDALSGLQSQVAGLAPRFAALDTARRAAERAVAAADASVAAEEKRRDELTARTAEFRKLNERALSHVDHVRKAHEATAAAAQVDISRRALADVETEMQTVTARLTALRAAAEQAHGALDALGEEQAAAREALEAERAALGERIAEARARRDDAATQVDPSTRSKYDRVRSRRGRTSVYALRGHSCSNCDTAIPTQRRSALASGTIVDVCESCGVLLYARPE